jgi:hypothetical protein
MTRRIRLYFALVLVATITGLVGFRRTPLPNDASTPEGQREATLASPRIAEDGANPAVSTKPTVLSAPLVADEGSTTSPYAPPATSGFRGYVGDTDHTLPDESPKVEFLPIPLLGGSHLP